jgi:hypothetical protein
MAERKDVDTEPSTSAYEELRSNNLKRNNEFLGGLGLSDASQKMAQRGKDRKRSKNFDAGAASAPLQLEAVNHPDKRLTRSSTHAGKLCTDGEQTAASFRAGQLVWAQHIDYGEVWWPATVTRRPRENSFTVTWDNPEGTETCSEVPGSKLHERRVCPCGNCTAESLVNTDALLQHIMKVSNCIEFENSTSRFKEEQVEGSRYGRERRDLSVYYN